MHVGLGFVMAYLSLVPPGMLNMTAVRTAIEKGYSSGRWFSLGAALVVIPQAFVALVFAKFFAQHPEVVERLNYAGVVVLFVLSVAFFLQARKKFKGEGKKRKGKSFVVGMLMSTMNMLAIPFYLVLTSVLENRGMLMTEQPFINLFVTGVFLGRWRLARAGIPAGEGGFLRTPKPHPERGEALSLVTGGKAAPRRKELTAAGFHGDNRIAIDVLFALLARVGSI